MSLADLADYADKTTGATRTTICEIIQQLAKTDQDSTALDSTAAKIQTK